MGMQPSRRSFLAGAGAAAVSLGWPGRRVRGANDDVRVAVAGLHRMGGTHMNRFQALSGVRVVSLCDPDRAVLQKRAEQLGVPVRTHTDPRSMLEDEDVDAVVVATPNHWHALLTVWACEAGKDVYVEKPASHTLWEGRQMIAAARRHKRMVQTGTQRRSDVHLVEALRQMRAGKLGGIRTVRLLFFVSREGLGRTTIEPPDSVDFDIWSGPAEKAPVRRRQFHHHWHYFWDFGNGELGDNGSHVTDLARIALGDPPLPGRVWTVAGRFGWDDHGETPNTLISWYDYEPAPLIAEIRNLPRKQDDGRPSDYRGHRAAIMVEAEDGYFAGLNGGAFYDYDDNRIETIDRGEVHRDHLSNFIAAARSRRVEDLNCDIRQGHLSGGLCHMGNIAYRVGEQAGAEAIRASIGGDPGGVDAFDRFAEHLAASGIDTERHPPTFGPSLSLDPETERFTGPGEVADAANALQRRAYREPFVLSEQV